MENKELTLAQQKKKELFRQKTNGYDKLAEGELALITEYCEGYKTFLDEGKTERECVDYAIALAEAAARHEDGGFLEEFLQSRQRVGGQRAIRGSGQGQAHGLRQVGRDGRVGRSRVRGGQKAGAGTQGRARAEAGGTGHTVTAAEGQDVTRVVLMSGPFPDRQERGRLVPGERMELRCDDGIGLRQDADVEEAYIATVFPGGI